MRYHIAVKFIALLLCAVALVTVACSGAGLVLLTELGQYGLDYETWYQKEVEERAHGIAQTVVQQYAINTLSQCPPELLEDYVPYDYDDVFTELLGLREESWRYTLRDSAGTVLESGGVLPAAAVVTGDTPLQSYSFTLSAWYPVASPSQGDTYYLKEEQSPAYAVTVELTALPLVSSGSFSVEQIQTVFRLRYSLIALLAAGFLAFCVTAVYLCCAAGRTKKGEAPSPGGLNKLPLDIYGAGAGVGCFLLLRLTGEIFRQWLLGAGSFPLGAVVLTFSVLLMTALLGIGFCFAVAAQVKCGSDWWRHTLVGWLWGRLYKGLRFCGRMLLRLMNMLPLVWRYLLLGGGMLLIPLFLLHLWSVGVEALLPLVVLSFAADVAVVCYLAYAFGTILRGARRMAEGDLAIKIPTRYLLGSFKRCARDLNELSRAAVLSAQQQMRSERMKTELITNVSHDIKTPLTSIINYVDLLEKPHAPQEERQYLEVLSRQSQRLKKLIEDLMELSKASTGNMAVEISRMDCRETVNQALGEFADKLEKAALTPVFRQPDSPLTMLADGRLTWRVLSNLLGNTVKYAQPGTRVYVDTAAGDGCVTISLKNISREPLNVSADELTERFVRGDVSRNTEGSGLGLNIAKSLMELQRGKLELVVDGDLFKVTLYFPHAGGSGS